MTTVAPDCYCEIPAKKFVVKKEGTNQGKYFYGCRVFTNPCDFFRWTDSSPPMNLIQTYSSPIKPNVSTDSILGKRKITNLDSKIDIIQLNDSQVGLKVVPFDKDKVGLIKSLSGTKYDATNKIWVLPSQDKDNAENFLLKKGIKVEDKTSSFRFYIVDNWNVGLDRGPSVKENSSFVKAIDSFGGNIDKSDPKCWKIKLNQYKTLIQQIRKYTILDSNNLLPEYIEEVLTKEAVVFEKLECTSMSSFIRYMKRINNGNVILSTKSPTRNLSIESMLYMSEKSFGKVAILSGSNVYQWEQDIEMNSNFVKNFKVFDYKEVESCAEFSNYIVDFLGLKNYESEALKGLDALADLMNTKRDKASICFLVEENSWIHNPGLFYKIISILNSNFMNEISYFNRYVNQKNNLLELEFYLKKSFLFPVDNFVPETLNYRISNPIKWIPLDPENFGKESELLDMEYQGSNAIEAIRKMEPLRRITNVAKLKEILKNVRNITDTKFIPNLRNKVIVLAGDPLLLIAAERTLLDYKTFKFINWKEDEMDKLENSEIVLTDFETSVTLTAEECCERCLILVLEIDVDLQRTARAIKYWRSLGSLSADVLFLLSSLYFETQLYENLRRFLRV